MSVCVCVCMTCVTRVRLPGCQAGSAIALRSIVHFCLGEYRECVLVQLTYNAASSYYSTVVLVQKGLAPMQRVLHVVSKSSGTR